MGQVGKIEEVVGGGHQHHVGNKVLPICESTSTTNNSTIHHHKKEISGSNNVIKSSVSCIRGINDDNNNSNPNKIKAIARMKSELLRWAAIAKQHQSNQKGSGSPAGKATSYISRKVAMFRNRSGNTIKALRTNKDNNSIGEVDEVGSLSSPKISFKWDVVSTCSATSAVSAFSTLSLPSASKTRRLIHHHNHTHIHSDLPRPPSISTSVVHQDDDQYNLNSDQISTPRLNWITTDDDFLVLEL